MRTVTLLAAIFIAASISHAENPAKDADAPQTFKAKYLVIYMVNKTNPTQWSTQILEKAVCRKLGDRWFICGSAPDLGILELNNSNAVWIPLNDACQFEEYDNQDKVKEMVERLRRR